jgi:hypothetical protein
MCPHSTRNNAEAKKILHNTHTSFTTIYIAKHFQNKYRPDDGIDARTLGGSISRAID